MKKHLLFLLCIGLIIFDLFAQKSHSIASKELDYFVISDTTKFPLKPPNTMSPRATMRHFITSMNRSYRILMNAYKQSQDEPGLFLSEDVKNQSEQAEYLFARSVHCLDLSEYPPTLRKDMGYEMALLLKEILDRIHLPPLEDIPNLEAVEEDLETKKYPKLLRWTVPNTNIVLKRIMEGEDEGEYLFSASTITELPAYYNIIKDQPYSTDKFVTKGYYNFFISTPGKLLPPKWARILPDWSDNMFYSQTIWQWIAYIISISLLIFLSRIFYFIFVYRLRKKEDIGKRWGLVLYLILVILMIEGLYVFLSTTVNLTNEVFVFTRLLFESISWVLISILSFYFIVSMSLTVIMSTRIKKMGIEATYTRAIFSILAFIVSIIILIYGLSQLGVSLLPIITGVGIGGLTIALAARSTMENIIASFTILADRPYRVGDRVKVKDHNGTIEEIGIRSTKVRTLTGPLVSIPNEKMAATEIENIQHRLFLRRQFDITITYNTSTEMIEKSLQIIRDILAVPELPDNKLHPNQAINHPDFPPHVIFDKFNPDSLNIYISYWHFPPDWWEFLKHGENINLEIIKRFTQEGIEFAFPTQTIHMESDKNSDKSDMEPA